MTIDPDTDLDAISEHAALVQTAARKARQAQAASGIPPAPRLSRQDLEAMIEQAELQEAWEAKVAAAPRDWRLLLAEAYADAEDHGLGTWLPTFRAAPDQHDQAAEFIKARCDWLAHRLED